MSEHGFVYIRSADGCQWRIPAEEIARHRAEHYYEPSGFNEDVYRDTLSTPEILTDWLSAAFTEADIVDWRATEFMGGDGSEDTVFDWAEVVVWWARGGDDE